MKPHTGGKTMSDRCNSVGLMTEKLNDLIDDTYADGNERYISWCIYPSEKDIDPGIEQPIRPYETDRMPNIGKIQDPTVGEATCVRDIEPQTCDPPAITACFHTHPSGDARFSSNDYANMLHERISLDCLGTRTKSGTGEQNTIMCDAIATDHENYELFRDTGKTIHSEYTYPASKNYVNAVSDGSQMDEINEAYKELLIANEVMLSNIEKAIDEGIMRRCSVASNISLLSLLPTYTPPTTEPEPRKKFRLLAPKIQPKQ